MSDSNETAADYPGGGKITLIIGPMLSGKSTELQRRVRRFRVARIPVCYVTSTMNTRDNELHVETHDNVKLTLDGKFSSLAECFTNMIIPAHANGNAIRVVAIDEGQFFKDLYPSAVLMANAGLHVIIAACDRLSSGLPFGDIYKLVVDAEEVVKLSAICSNCLSEQGAFSQRRDMPLHMQLAPLVLQQYRAQSSSNPTTISSDSDSSNAGNAAIQPGGGAIYTTLCRHCLVDKLKKGE